MHYRAIGAELYKKFVQIPLQQHNLRELSKKVNTADVRKKRRFISDFLLGTKLGLKDIGHAFNFAEQALGASDNPLSALVVYSKAMPSVMTVGALLPEFDYDGRKLQELGTIETCYDNAQHPRGRRARGFVHDLAKRPSRTRGLRKILLLPKCRAHHSTLAIQTGFEHLENTCMNPTWWDSLKAGEQNSLVTRMQESELHFWP